MRPRLIFLTLDAESNDQTLLRPVLVNLDHVTRIVPHPAPGLVEIHLTDGKAFTARTTLEDLTATIASIGAPDGFA